MNSFVAALPMAFVMVAGPQIVTAVFLATSEDWLKNSLAFLAAVALASTLGTSIAYFLTQYFKQSSAAAGTGATLIDYVLVALLLYLMVRTYQRRKIADVPKWMGRLQTATPGSSFKIAFLLFMLMPTDIASMVTVGGYLAHKGAAWSYMLIFVAATLLLAGIPFLLDLVLGKRAKTALPTTREWMTRNSWIVNEIVIAFFLAMEINTIVQG